MSWDSDLVVWVRRKIAGSKLSDARSFGNNVDVSVVDGNRYVFKIYRTTSAVLYRTDSYVWHLIYTNAENGCSQTFKRVSSDLGSVLRRVADVNMYVSSQVDLKPYATFDVIDCNDRTLGEVYSEVVKANSTYVKLDNIRSVLPVINEDSSAQHGVVRLDALKLLGQFIDAPLKADESVLVADREYRVVTGQAVRCTTQVVFGRLRNAGSGLYFDNDSFDPCYGTLYAKPDSVYALEIGEDRSANRCNGITGGCAVTRSLKTTGVKNVCAAECR